jgi:hypothetical protein
MMAATPLTQAAKPWLVTSHARDAVVVVPPV